jgi:shikimate kinase
MIVLIGMPGSGKSTVGRAGAPHATAVCRFRHGDRAAPGLPIRDYFDREGEAAFRDVEQAVIDELTQGPPGVLATGGAVLRPLNRQHLHERGTVIYLRSSPETLFRRLRHDTKRPLLQVDDPLARLRALYAERDPLYRQCALRAGHPRLVDVDAGGTHHDAAGADAAGRRGALSGASAWHRLN